MYQTNNFEYQRLVPVAKPVLDTVSKTTTPCNRSKLTVVSYFNSVPARNFPANPFHNPLFPCASNNNFQNDFSKVCPIYLLPRSTILLLPFLVSLTAHNSNSDELFLEHYAIVFKIECLEESARYTTDRARAHVEISKFKLNFRISIGKIALLFNEKPLFRICNVRSSMLNSKPFRDITYLDVQPERIAGI